MYYCHNCGTPLQEDARFCFNCGAEQPTEDAAPAPQARAAAPTAQAARAHTPAHAKPAAPRPAPAAKPAESAPARQPSAATAAPKPQPAQAQATLGELTHTWENVKISGEFKNGVGTITITFS